MPKLAIYVPKKDMRQIERWRKKINFSRVFMRALMAEIHERERAGKSSKKGEKQMAEAAAHYRQELVAQGSLALDDEAYQLGFNQVVQCHLSAESIRAMLLLQDKDEWAGDERQRVKESLGDGQDRLLAVAREHGFDESSRPVWETSVLRAYTKGVADAWRRVCEEMGAR
jgi:hypothetical protein